MVFFVQKNHKEKTLTNERLKRRTYQADECAADEYI